MIVAYLYLAAVAAASVYACGSDPAAVRPSHGRRASTLREAARRQQTPAASLDTFRNPRRSPVIFASECWQQRSWCDRLGVTGEALRSAMREVGPMAADIRRYFMMSNT